MLKYYFQVTHKNLNQGVDNEKDSWYPRNHKSFSLLQKVNLTYTNAANLKPIPKLTHIYPLTFIR